MIDLTVRAPGAFYWLRNWQEYKDQQLRYCHFPCEHGPATQSFDYALERAPLDAETSREIRTAARAMGVTVYAFMYAAFCVLLHSYTGRTRLTVWTNLHNRSRTHAAEVVGWFVSSHMLGVDLRDNPSGVELVQKLQKDLTMAHRYMHVPLSHLWRVIGRSLEKSDVRVIFEQVTKKELDLGSGIAATEVLPHRWSGQGHLTVSVSKGTTLELTAMYSTVRFNSAFMRGFLERLCACALGLVYAPTSAVSTY